MTAAAMLVLTAPPATAAPAPFYPCNSIIYNACFYSEPGFNGVEHRKVLHSPGCYTLPPSRSYHMNPTPAAIAYEEEGCTGRQTEISGYFGFDIGFTALSLRYPAE